MSWMWEADLSWKSVSLTTNAWELRGKLFRLLWLEGTSVDSRSPPRRSWGWYTRWEPIARFLQWQVRDVNWLSISVNCNGLVFPNRRYETAGEKLSFKMPRGGECIWVNNPPWCDDFTNFTTGISVCGIGLMKGIVLQLRKDPRLKTYSNSFES